MPPPVKQHPLGFFQLDPIPTPEVLTDFYQSRYYDLLRKDGRAPELRRLMEPGRERDEELGWLEATLYVDVADAIGAHSTASGAVLDVGCGAGDLVAWLSGRGFQALGIDPSVDAVGAARARRIDAHCATLETWAKNAENAGKYRAITLMNVLEHVPDPLAVLGCVRDLLARGGVLVFRVPNDFTAIQSAAEATGVERAHWWVSAPDHINYFRAESARAACESVGLEVKDVSADFPMEFFLLMGMNYVDHKDAGRQAHALRRKFELSMPTAMRQRLYRNFAAQGLGRNILVTAGQP